MRSPGKAALILAVLTAAACEDATAPEETSLFNADVAVVAADGAMEGVSLMSDPNLHRGSPFDRTRTVTFYDATGAVQAAYDALTTASMKVNVDVTGTAERERWTASVERHSEMVVTGLAGTETTRTFNGGGTEKILRSRITDEFGTRTYDMTGEFTYANVVVPVPGASDSPWPLSGTITRHMVVVITNGPNGDVTRERTVVITFNGTQFATISVDGEVSELDLATRKGRFFHPLFQKMRDRRNRGG